MKRRNTLLVWLLTLALIFSMTAGVWAQEAAPQASPTAAPEATAQAPDTAAPAPEAVPEGDDVQTQGFGADVVYTTHVQNIGWQSPVKDGTMAGTSGRSLRLEGMTVRLESPKYSGSVEYRTHIQNIGWEQQWKKDGEMSGTQGLSYRLEAMQVRLTGDMEKNYDIYYRVHAQNYGWLGWAKNGEEAGTAGYSYRLEGMQIVTVNKGDPAPNLSPASARSQAFINRNAPKPTPTVTPTPSVYKEQAVMYRTHVQNIGWQNYAVNGGTAGTSGQGYRVEALACILSGQKVEGDIEYRSMVQNIGWESVWRKNGQLSGTEGRGLRVEAIQARLTGAMSGHYDLYYRVHAQNYGWLGWAKNGEQAGTEGFSYRLEAIQMMLVPRGEGAPTIAPGSSYKISYISRTEEQRLIGIARGKGYETYSGTLKFCNTRTEVDNIVRSAQALPDKNYKLPYALFVFDTPQNISCKYPGKAGLVTRSQRFVALSNPEKWRSYNTSHLTIGIKPNNSYWSTIPTPLDTSTSIDDAMVVLDY